MLRIPSPIASGRSFVWLLVVALALVVAGAAPPPHERPLFVDDAAGAGLDFVHFNGMSGELYFVEMTGAGVGLLDYDNDGDLDVYLVQGTMLGPGKTLADATFAPRGPLPPGDRLYRNDLEVLPDGTRKLHFTDVTAASKITAAGYGMGVAAGDYDNDGWVDLYVTNFGSNQLWHNNGDGTFSDVTAKSGTDDTRWSVSAAWVDYDRDGYLDLYVGNYVDYRLATQKPCATATGEYDYCGPLAYDPTPDRLFHNRGDGTFEDVSATSGIDGEFGGALGVVVSDFDSDGWPDIYVANDQMPNQLWINRHDGTFTNGALLGGCAVNQQGMPQASMGVVAGDLDGDGSDDLFMAHLTRDTNTLYLNDGHGMFTDSTQPSGLGMPSWSFTGFGTALFDYDNDGWLDLFVANGAVKRIQELARAGDPYPLHQTNQLFHNLGGRFVEVTAQAGPVFSLSEVSRGVAAGDVDNDGDTDLVVSNNAGPVRLLVNQGASGRHWLGLRLVSPRLHRDAYGARVAVTLSDGRTLWRRVGSDGSYASSNDPRLLVGLGDATAVRAVVRWPDGTQEAWNRLDMDRYQTLTEGRGEPVR